jgi:hypothetical protein
MAPPPQTPDELVAHGWLLVQRTLAGAESERLLVTHWFVTAEDDSVHSDEHFGSDERTTRFLGVVLPTLIDQLAPSLVMVAVPWGLGGEDATMSVVALLPGQPAAFQSRTLRRSGESGPPWWSLGGEQVSSPVALAELSAALRLPAASAHPRG